MGPPTGPCRIAGWAEQQRGTAQHCLPGAQEKAPLLAEQGGNKTLVFLAAFKEHHWVKLGQKCRKQAKQPSTAPPAPYQNKNLFKWGLFHSTAFVSMVADCTCFIILIMAAFQNHLWEKYFTFHQISASCMGHLSLDST